MTKKRAESIDDLKPVYLLYGDEEYLANEALSRLRGMFEMKEGGELNIEVLNAVETDVDRIIDIAEVAPMMLSRRLVIVNNADKLSKKGKDALISYIKEPNERTVLVLVTKFPQPGEVKDSNIVKKVEASPLYKQVKQTGEALKFAQLKKGRQSKVELWVRSEFKSRGKKVTDGAVAVLLKRAGTELRDLNSAVEQVCLYAGGTVLISEDMVADAVYRTASHGVFELVDTVADRRRDLSLLLLNRLVNQGENPQNLFNLLLRQFRMIATVKSLYMTCDQREIASIAGIPPFLVYKCENQAKRFSSERLRGIFLEFKKAQFELYNVRYLPSSEYQSLIIEKLIVKIIG